VVFFQSSLLIKREGQREEMAAQEQNRSRWRGRADPDEEAGEPLGQGIRLEKDRERVFHPALSQRQRCSETWVEVTGLAGQ
jgi:hypothetical protein